MPIECILKMVSKLMKFCRHKKQFSKYCFDSKKNNSFKKSGVKKIKLLFSLPPHGGLGSI